MQLRGYVNSKHELTDWGKCFVEAIKALDSANSKIDSQTYESVFLAVEMLRMGVLGPNNWFPQHSGGPMRGSGTVVAIYSTKNDADDQQTKINHSTFSSRESHVLES